MADTIHPETFAEIVEWAYSTLPQKIRDLPDFPGIQGVDEPPGDVLRDLSNGKKWRRGAELLGLYVGVPRTKQRHNLLRIAPDLIFVFRGPILGCFKGDLRAEVKRVVWHEVAHWLGHDEEEVKELGLTSPSLGGEDRAQHPLESEAPKTVLQPRPPGHFCRGRGSERTTTALPKVPLGRPCLPRTRQTFDLGWSGAEQSCSCPGENLYAQLVWVRTG
jgi:predicted Zn-dependent protease with MMP-like domain